MLSRGLVKSGEDAIMGNCRVPNNELTLALGNSEIVRLRIFIFVIRASLAICMSMVLYILIKQLLFRGHGMLQLDMFVMVMAGSGASMAAYAALREVYSLRQRVIDEINERAKVEDQRVKVEKALEGSEEKYHNIFDNATEGIFQRTAEGGLLSINPAFARMHGFKTPPEMMIIVNTDRQLYVNSDDAQLFKRLMVSQGYVVGLEAQRYRKDKSIFWTSTNAHVVRDENGEILFFEGTMQEITKRKEAEERLARTLQNLQKGMGATIQLLAHVVETRDPYTAGHQRRVASLAHAIAKEMKLPEEVGDGIHMAGTIHDLGKISIPAELLSKPGKLTTNEFRLIKDHCQIGFETLREAEFPFPIATIILQHHERLDGSGYPHGLKGDEILCEARILTVADVVEAIVSHRPYRPGLGVEKALEEISRNKGKTYDPEVVDACLKVFREREFKFE